MRHVVCAALVTSLACNHARKVSEPIEPAHDARTIEPASSSAVPEVRDGRASVTTLGPGFPLTGPWVSFYGSGKKLDVEAVAKRYRVINIDADPGNGNLTDDQLRALRAGGNNTVLSYLDVGSCENWRTYWSSAPSGLVPCGANRAAQLGDYEGYPEEKWMDVGNAEYQRLLLEHVIARVAPRVDGLYLDNLEILEHPECGLACRRGGFDLVQKIRQKYPDLLLVMQNATSDVTRLARTTDGTPFPQLLDGISHEEVYSPTFDATAEQQLLAWKAMGLVSKKGHPFWIAIEDYAGNCNNRAKAELSFSKGRAQGFSVYVSDASSGQQRVCNFDL